MKYVFFLLIPFSLFSQENTKEKKYKLNASLGLFEADWYKFYDNSKYIEIGIGNKINADFWLNVNLKYVQGSGPNDPYNNKLGKNPYDSNQIILSLLIQKYFDLGKKIQISGRIGPYINYSKFYDYSFENTIKYNKEQNIYIGAIVSPEINYNISENFGIGISSSVSFELGYGYIGFYIGPKVDYFF